MNGKILHHPGIGEVPARVIYRRGDATCSENFHLNQLAQCRKTLHKIAVGTCDFVAAAQMQFRK